MVGRWLVGGWWLVTKDLMPRDITSSEPRHWMVFGQFVMPVQCCAEARRRRVPQHSTAQVLVLKSAQGIQDGFLDSRRVLGFTMDSWIHDGLQDSRWLPGFTMGSKNIKEHWR